MTRKSSSKESVVGLEGSSAGSPHTVTSVISAEGNYNDESPGTRDATKSLENVKKRRRRRKKRDTENSADYPEDDVIRAMRMLESDVVLEYGKSRSNTKENNACNVIFQSIPVEKVFVENDRGFKAFDNVDTTSVSINEQRIIDRSLGEQLMEVALTAERWMHNFAFACRGLLGGMSLCQIISILQHQSSCQFSEYMSCCSTVFHTFWCFLLMVCTVSVIDRVDVKRLKERHLCDLGFVSVVLYSVSLLITLCFNVTEEKLYFSCSHGNVTGLWNQADGGALEIEILRKARLSVSAVTLVGWLLVTIHPQNDAPYYLMN